MAEIWKGAPAANALTEALKLRTAALLEKGIRPVLSIIRVGERADDLSYEKGALSRCSKIGIEVRLHVLPSDCSEERLISQIQLINEDDSVHGCLLFRPLPKHINEQAVCSHLKPEKDVDCITQTSLASVFAGKGPGFAPCTAEACVRLLDYYGYDLTGKNAVVIGRSLVIGKPVSMLLLGRNATVTICHTRTKDLAAICKKADLIIAAAGKAHMADISFMSPGQIILDVGIHDNGNGGLCGDVDTDAAIPVVRAVTPVPGGVGSVTTTVLALHVLEAAEAESASKSDVSIYTPST